MNNVFFHSIAPILRIQNTKKFSLKSKYPNSEQPNHPGFKAEKPIIPIWLSGKYFQKEINNGNCVVLLLLSE